MGLSLFEQVVHEHPLHLHRLSADQFERMIAAGVLPEGEPVELIEGLLIQKNRADRGGEPMTNGPRHAAAVRRLAELDQTVRSLGFHVRCQLPIRASERSEAEPDGAIVRGTLEDFEERHPKPAEVAIVIEVADSSLEYDRETKRALYARAGIAWYVIVNLQDRVLEVFANPDQSSGTYPAPVVVPGTEAIELPVGTGVVRLDGRFLIR